MASGEGDGMGETTEREGIVSDAADVAAPEDQAGPNGAEGSVTVAASGLQITVEPTTAAVTERLAALNARLSRLERDLADVAKRIEGVEPGPDAPEPVAPADEQWRAFLDLQRIVADRLDRR
jgi:hypothetical protein